MTAASASSAVNQQWARCGKTAGSGARTAISSCSHHHVWSPRAWRADFAAVPWGVNLAYGGTTPASLGAPNTAFYSQVLTGARTLVLRRTADVSVTVATINFTMAEEDRTVYATAGNAGGAVNNFQTVDDNTAPGADLAAATPTVANLANQQASGYVTMAAGTYVVRTVPAGTAPAARAAGVNLAIAAQSYPALGGRTILIADAAAGGTPLRGFVYSDR